MNCVKKISQTPLGIPLTMSAVATVASLALGKKWHPYCGAVWVALSFWHAWQHRTKLKLDAQSLARMRYRQHLKTKENFNGKI